MFSSEPTRGTLSSRHSNLSALNVFVLFKIVVANCSWEEARPRCQMGYLNSDDVSYYTTLRISHVARGTWGNYSCWHEGSISDQQETCHLYFDDNGK